MSGQTLVDVVRSHAQQRGGATAFSFEGRETSYLRNSSATATRSPMGSPPPGSTAVIVSPMSARTATTISSC